MSDVCIRARGAAHVERSCMAAPVPVTLLGMNFMMISHGSLRRSSRVNPRIHKNTILDPTVAPGLSAIEWWLRKPKALSHQRSFRE